MTVLNSTDFQAAAYTMLSDCAIRGYEVYAVVSRLRNGALSGSFSTALVVIAAVLPSVAM